MLHSQLKPGPSEAVVGGEGEAIGRVVWTHQFESALTGPDNCLNGAAADYSKAIGRLRRQLRPEDDFRGGGSGATGVRDLRVITFSASASSSRAKFRRAKCHPQHQKSGSAAPVRVMSTASGNRCRSPIAGLAAAVFANTIGAGGNRTPASSTLR